MRKTLLALGLIATFSANAAMAEETKTTVSGDTSAVAPNTKLVMPAIKDRRHMLFQFGMFGTEFHLGWKKPKAKEDVATGEFRGFGSPIIFQSFGKKAIGLGTPKVEKIKMDQEGDS